MAAQQEETYTNPVYRHASPDPFVLKYGGEYWCYFTGLRPDGRAFGILHSTNLVRWREVGSALDPLPGELPCYWAPEVTYENGRFYMYYSVGDEERMTIRVAVAGRPNGPFVDSGHALTTEKFAIDPHVLIDEDGAHYLFYAVDFLDYERIGTGVVCARLADPFTLAGPGRPVVRALYDWQIYDPHREAKGGVRWHTVEGPFVLKHAGRYYMMFSGGNWQNQSYGVAYAVAEHLATPQEWRQIVDGRATLPILRSLPQVGVIGPGHNSVVRGLNNCELYCAYHRWQPETEERVLAIDRMGWEGERLRVYGPSTGPQPVPTSPAVAGFAGFVQRAGNWTVEGNAARLRAVDEFGDAALPLPAGDLVLELSLAVTAPAPGAARAAAGGDAVPAVTLSLEAGGQPVWAWTLEIGGPRAAIAADGVRKLTLPPAFDPSVLHLLRLELAGDRARLIVDHPSVLAWEGRLARPPTELHLRAAGGCASEWRGLAIAQRRGG
jgi:GH43 family beta-xylosidase